MIQSLGSGGEGSTLLQRGGGSYEPVEGGGSWQNFWKDPRRRALAVSSLQNWLMARVVVRIGVYWGKTEIVKAL